MQTSCSAGVAGRVQPVLGFAEGEMNVSTQRLPAKKEQAVQGKKCRELFLPLFHPLMVKVSLLSVWGALPRGCHLADRGLSHNNTFCSHSVCSPLALSTEDLSVLL